jgi:5-methylcytosine-specific restriction endonuclease McrA
MAIDQPMGSRLRLLALRMVQRRQRQAHPITGSRVILTVAHFDHQPENVVPANLAALCQRCHNRYDAATRAAGRADRLRPAAPLCVSGRLALRG